MGKLVTYSNNVIVNKKPNKKEIENLQKRINAFDVAAQLTMTLCPLKDRDEPNSVEWDWAIVTVAGFDIPAMMNTLSYKTSLLYTTNNRVVQLSHEECALATAYIYFDIIRSAKSHFDDVIEKRPYYSVFLSGLDDIYDLDAEMCNTIREEIRRNLTDKGMSVLY